MPVEKGYTSQIGPSAGPGPVLTSAAAVGGGVANALEQAGDVVHASQVRAYQVQRQQDQQSQTADFYHRFAQARQHLDGIQDQLRSNAGPGGAGHVQDLSSVLDTQGEALFAGITEQRVLDQAKEQWDSYRTQTVGAAQNWAEGQSIAKRWGDTKGSLDTSRNRAATSSDPQAWAIELKASHALIAASGLPPDKKEELARYADDGISGARLDYLNRTDPVAAKALLDSGMFNSHLQPATLEKLQRGNEVELRRRDAEAQSAVVIARGQYREMLATVKEQAGQGIYDENQIKTLAGQAQQFGDTSALADLQGLAREHEFARVWGAVSPLQRERRIGELNGKPEAKRTADEQAELHWLQSKGDALDDQFRKDPAGFVARNGPAGSAPPALDPQHPESFAARVQWARGMVPAYGMMKLLTRSEADALRERSQEGGAGRRETIETLAAFGDAARAAARQVNPADHHLWAVVALPPAYRNAALQGGDARRADPNVIRDPNGDVNDASYAGLKRDLDQAMEVVPVADRDAVLSVARDLAAYELRTKGGEMSPALFFRSLNMALGGDTGGGGERRGGIGRWNDHAFLVPENMSAQNFTNLVFEHVARYPAQAPVNPDGSPVNLRMAYPRMVRPGTYRFFVGERVVRGKSGGAWEFTVLPKK